MKVIVGITGASGVQYAIKLLESLKWKKVKVGLIVSKHGAELIRYETSYSLKQVQEMTDEIYSNDNLAAPIASGSQKFDAFVIVPCSASTLSKIACGIADNLITRTSSICLKERRKLVLVPRETPLSTIHLENMHQLSKHGAVVLPAMPGFYHKPKKIEDILNFIVGKILEQLGLDQNLYKKWEPAKTGRK